MSWLRECITDFDGGREAVRARRYGVIETARGRLAAVHLRPWPKLVALPEVWPLVGPRYHTRGEPDRCLLYYNQPRRMSRFLALKYVVSTSGTSYRTFRAALVVLDQIAEIKGVDAIVCDAANYRLSDRLMARLGWEPHKPERWHRNYIRRFYGTYPVHAARQQQADQAASDAASGSSLAVGRHVPAIASSGLVGSPPRC